MGFGPSRLHWSGCLLVSFWHWECGAYTKLNGDGEEVTAGLLSNGIATWDTWEVDESRLDNALFAVKTSEDLLCEAFQMLGQSSTVEGRITGIRHKPWRA